ncbi:jg20536, partial [Pararge aegeria aegeria]
ILDSNCVTTAGAAMVPGSDTNNVDSAYNAESQVIRFAWYPVSLRPVTMYCDTAVLISQQALVAAKNSSTFLARRNLASLGRIYTSPKECCVYA